jgi:hypothetical protein
LQITWWLLCLVGEEYAFAEEGEAGAAVGLAFDELDLGDGAFDFAAAPGEGESVADGVVVAADAVGEG